MSVMCPVHLCRIGEINLSWNNLTGLEWENMSRNLSTPAPKLLRLCLHARRRCEMPGNLFGGIPPPKLQQVELHGFRLPKVEKCLGILAPSLTSLVLSRCRLESHWNGSGSIDEEVNTGPASSDRTFFDLLSMLPLLETLSITKTTLPGDLEQDHIVHPGTPISMPNLRQFTLLGSLRVVTRVLTNIILLNDAALTLSFAHGGLNVRDTFIDLPALFVVFEKHFGAAAKSGAYYSHTSIDLDVDINDATHHALYEFTGSSDISQQMLPTGVEFHHYWDSESDAHDAEVARFAAELCKRVPNNGPDVSIEITHLCPIDDAEGASPKDWYQVVADISCLAHLRLRYRAGIDFLSWLTDHASTPHQPNGNELHPSRYPVLCSLELADECHVTRDTTLPHIMRLLEHHYFAVTVVTSFVDSASYDCLRDTLGDALHWEKTDNWMVDARADSRDYFT